MQSEWLKIQEVINGLEALLSGAMQNLERDTKIGDERAVVASQHIVDELKFYIQCYRNQLWQ